MYIIASNITEFLCASRYYALSYHINRSLVKKTAVKKRLNFLILMLFMIYNFFVFVYPLLRIA